MVMYVRLRISTLSTEINYREIENEYDSHFIDYTGLFENEDKKQNKPILTLVNHQYMKNYKS